jgi:GNAT superfamily N-acetyltransferase
MEYATQLGAYKLSTDKSRLDITVIHRFLSEESYWAKDIPLQTVERIVAHSLCFGLYDGEIFIGFARMITDITSYAYLADVFILPEYRGKGLSKWMMQCILEHPDLQGLRRIMLATRDAHGLYAQFGFTSLDTPERFMQLHRPNVYQTDVSQSDLNRPEADA